MVVVLVLMVGCASSSKKAEPQKPETIQLTRAEVAIVQAINAKFLRVDASISAIESKLDLLIGTTTSEKLEPEKQE